MTLHLSPCAMRTLACAALLALVGCKTAPVRLAEPVTAPTPVQESPRAVTFTLDDGEAVTLSAALWHRAGHKAPAVVLVPGGGDVSHLGLRPSDGVVRYKNPVPVYANWAEALAQRGAMVLAYDKRTCGPNDDVACQKNPQGDIDARGPVALAKDVDAACQLVRAEPDFDGRLVLITHGQGTQVVLSSQCAASAQVLVLFSPVPRGVDDVIVSALRERMRQLERSAVRATDAARKAELQKEAAVLRDQAGTREAEFRSMKQGRFEKTARIQGATLAFWQGWLELTAQTPTLLSSSNTPRVVVLGQNDVQLSQADAERAKAMGTAGIVELPQADHHLLVDEQLTPETVNLVGQAIDQALSSGQPQS